jgi:hypothetical protein
LNYPGAPVRKLKLAFNTPINFRKAEANVASAKGHQVRGNALHAG